MFNKKISIILPIYNEEECLPELWRRLNILFKKESNYSFECIFINDSSSDRSKEILIEIAKENKQAKLVDFSRNFGHQISITAGLDLAEGDAVVIIDADLQDPPELIGEMLRKYEQGYDVVYAQRKYRKGESIFKRGTAALFYKLINLLTDRPIPINTGDFRLISRKVVNVVNKMKEHNRFLRGIVSWAGFKQIPVEFVRDERYKGETKYPLKKMCKFALDGILSFSNIPLKISTWLGFMVSIISLSYIVVVLIKKYLGYTLPGYASLMVAILFLGGVQLIAIGILGEYIARIYNEEKKRPLYVINEVYNIKETLS